jgi:hypothetical protein
VILTSIVIKILPRLFAGGIVAVLQKTLLFPGLLVVMGHHQWMWALGISLFVGGCVNIYIFWPFIKKLLVRLRILRPAK